MSDAAFQCDVVRMLAGELARQVRVIMATVRCESDLRAECEAAELALEMVEAAGDDAEVEEILVANGKQAEDRAEEVAMKARELLPALHGQMTRTAEAVERCAALRLEEMRLALSAEWEAVLGGDGDAWLEAFPWVDHPRMSALVAMREAVGPLRRLALEDVFSLSACEAAGSAWRLAELARALADMPGAEPLCMAGCGDGAGVGAAD